MTGEGWKFGVGGEGGPQGLNLNALLLEKKGSPAGASPPNRW